MQKGCRIILERQTGTSPCSALQPYSWILTFMPCALGRYLEYVVCKCQRRGERYNPCSCTVKTGCAINFSRPVKRDDKRLSKGMESRNPLTAKRV